MYFHAVLWIVDFVVEIEWFLPIQTRITAIIVVISEDDCVNK
jgi:hypothetical protein